MISMPALLLALTLGGGNPSQAWPLDTTQLIPVRVVGIKAEEWPSSRLKRLTVEEFVAMPPTLSTLAIINRRLVLEAEAATFARFATEVIEATKHKKDLTSAVILEAIVAYCQQAMLNGNLQYSPVFYQKTYAIANKMRTRLSPADKNNHLLLFQDTDQYGTKMGLGIDWEKIVGSTQALSAPIRLNLARRLTIRTMSLGIDSLNELKVEEKWLNQLLDTLEKQDGYRGAAGYLKVSLLATKGKRAEARALAERNRTNPDLPLHYRESLFRYIKSGNPRDLSAGFKHPLPLGWKRGD